MIEQFCFDCVFFVPEGMTHNDLKPGQWDKNMAGDCRRNCPVAAGPAEDGRVNYSYWPIVIASDWCGESRPREE